MTSHLDPTRGRSANLYFPHCQVRLDGDDLVVTVSAPGVVLEGARCTSDSAGIAWDPPASIAGDVTLACEGQGHARRDRSDYPSAAAYPSKVSFRFTGAVAYGRVPYEESWALQVEGALVAAIGLPDGFDLASYDAVVVSSSANLVARSPSPVMGSALHGGSGAAAPLLGGGPHLPFP